jgi:hypothetical protein
MVVVVLKTVQTGKYTYTTPTNIWATLSRVIIHCEHHQKLYASRSQSSL